RRHRAGIGVRERRPAPAPRAGGGRVDRRGLRRRGCGHSAKLCRRGGEDMTDEPQDAQGQPTEEELRAALEEQMKRITVKDVLLQTVITLINVSARKLGLAGDEGEKDLEQAK